MRPATARRELGRGIIDPDRAVATITNPTSNPVTLEGIDLEIWLVVELTPEEAELRKAAAPARVKQRLSRQKIPISQKIFPAKILNSSQGADRPTYLIPAGQTIWVQARTGKPVTPFDTRQMTS